VAEVPAAPTMQRGQLLVEVGPPTAGAGAQLMKPGLPPEEAGAQLMKPRPPHAEMGEKLMELGPPLDGVEPSDVQEEVAVAHSPLSCALS
jgi:hypothetical protein